MQFVATTTRRPADRRRAFSMAELMIALALLGIGLLIIGAALPVAIMKTRATSEAAVGDACAETALDLLAARLRLARNRVSGSGAAARVESIFRPRVPDGYAFKGALGGDLAPAIAPSDPREHYEPFIKVRPLIAGNVFAVDGSEDRGEPIENLTELIEEQIRVALDETDFTMPPPGLEFIDISDAFDYRSNDDGLLPPAVSVLDVVYPTVAFDERLAPANDFLDSPSRMVERYPVRWPDGPSGENARGDETLKALQRQVAWVAFYRRLAYDKVDPLPADPTTVVEAADPTQYELIVVAVRRTTTEHRFPVPDVSNWDPADPQFHDEDDTLAPIPVLVHFTEINWLDGGTSPVNDDYFNNSEERPLYERFLNDEPATLTFVCSKTVGALLPEDSIFIPAVNDSRPTTSGNPVNYTWPVAGFVPAAPDALPIYTVLDREVNDADDDDAYYRLRVANNGFYPWADDAVTSNGDPEEGVEYWPAWVIPPATTGRDDDDQPIFEQRTPILSVKRRVVALPEVLVE